MKVITVDRGNTACKLAYWQGTELVKTAVMESSDAGSLQTLLCEYAPDGCIYSSVGDDIPDFVGELKDAFEERLLIAGSNTPYPAKVFYSSRETLGFDRLAAVAGATAYYPETPLLVVDAGTALTLDICDHDGNFLGGNIAPGVTMRLKSLHDYTHRLPLVDKNGWLPAFGDDTESAIRSGCIGGTIAQIAETFVKASSLYSVTKIVVTGGDANLLFPLLVDRELPVVHEPHLVDRGLLSIYMYNRSIHSVP